MQKNELFTINHEQALLTSQLQQIIINDIKENNGYIPFSRYMELALYHPQYGYYNNLLYKFGKLGDFITAPLTSRVFGICISRQLLQLFENDVTANILEIGSGNGQLMLDLLASIGNSINKYYILELSPNLANLQKERLLSELPQYQAKVVWLTNLPQHFKGVILANEVLDAQPCELVHWKDGQIKLRGVVFDHDNFNYVDKNININNEVSNIVKELNIKYDDYTSEINLINRGFIRSLADSLAKGVVLLIDYGYGVNEYYSKHRHKGTIRGFFRHHQLDNVLLYPGLIDITASVDFTAIASVGIKSKLELIGYTTQANFLINCGLGQVIEDEAKKLTQVEYLNLTNQINRLISPNEMGELFKVMAFSKSMTFSEFLGFSSGDKTYTL